MGLIKKLKNKIKRLDGVNSPSKYAFENYTLCYSCRNFRTDRCPNSSERLDLDDSPYFEDVNEEKYRYEKF